MRLQANDTINMLEAEVDELQAELAATQAVAAKHQRHAAASGQEVKVLQRLSSSGENLGFPFTRNHSLTNRRSATGHRSSEGGMLMRHGSAPDALEMQFKVESLEAEVAQLQQKLSLASTDRTAELEHVQQLNRALKAEIAAMQSNLSGMMGQPAQTPISPARPPMPAHPALRDDIQLESFGSCLLLESPDHLQRGVQTSNVSPNQAAYTLGMHRLAPIMEVDSISNRTSTAEEAEQLVPVLQNQVHSLATSLQVKTSEAEALHQMVEHLENKVGHHCAMRLTLGYGCWPTTTVGVQMG